MSDSLYKDEKASIASTTPIDELRPKQDNVGSTYIQSRGVTAMEAVHASVRRKTKHGRLALWAVAISIMISAWAYSLEQSTTSNYAAFATSDFASHSSGLASLSIATSIIGTVCKPFIAKISDITSRPYTYILTLTLFVVGYIIIAFSPTLAAYVIGSVFAAIGANGLDFLNDVIVADLTPLEWRGFLGSMLSTPFLINTWFAGLIVSDLTTGGNTDWRWGYGMFAIIIPVCLVPAIVTLIFLERRATKEGLVNLASSTYAHRLATEAAAEKGIEAPKGAVEAPAVAVELSWAQKLRSGLAEADAFGLILLGFGWTLFLLPFSLEKTAKGNWNNPSMIAMLVVGAVLLVAYVLYERFVATVPSFPRRLLYNKTFMMAIVIDFFYLMCGNLRGLYLSSYTYIVTTWDLQSWTYFSNTMSLSLCFFGVVAGLIQRWTHRYKTLQIVGLSIKIIGIGILLNGKAATSSTGALVMSQILIGAGGSFSVVGSRVAAQASVPHQDLALVMALLSLWSSVGGSVGSAIASQIWAHFMPKNLRTYLPSSVNDTQVMTFYGNIKKIHVYPYDSEIRQGALEAYRLTLWHLIVPAVCLSFIPLIAACFQTNFYLGKQQNAVMNVSLEGTRVDDAVPDTPTQPLTFKDKLLRFWAGKQN